MAAEGKEMVARGEQMQMALREKALQRAAETAATPAEAFVISHSLRESSWPEVLNQLASRVLADLWQNGLSGVYFGGAYVFEDQMYRQVDKLSGAFEDALVRADGTRFSFAGLARIELVKREDVHELVLYPEPGNESRSENPEEAEGEILTADEPGRVTVVVAEIVPGPRDLMPIVSLRAFDLATWQILSAPMRRVSLTPELVEALGVTSPSPEGGSKKIEEVVLKNPSSFIERLQQAPTGAFLFRMDYTGLGLVDPLNQAVPLITKSILAELAGLAVSDYDFLVRAMVLSKGRREAVSGEENAVWLLNFEEEKEEGEAALATLFASRLNDDGQAEPREVAEVRVELGEADRE
jgi:hypothetical protein